MIDKARVSTRAFFLGFSAAYATIGRGLKENSQPSRLISI
jgi:hypothetical protein